MTVSSGNSRQENDPACRSVHKSVCVPCTEPVGGSHLRNTRVSHLGPVTAWEREQNGAG